MNKIWIAGAFVFAFLMGIKFMPPVVIRGDGGGVSTYYQISASVNGLMQRHVWIDGECYSACLFFMHRDYNVPVCITERAVLGIHYPYLSTGNYTKADHKRLDHLGDYMMAGLPEYLKRYIRKNNIYIPKPARGDPPNELALFPYEVLRHAYDTCS